MPGRHSGGSSLGGGGGFRGGGGAGFGGGGGGFGGWGGGGWGGGWRPRGPWYPRPYYGGGWGLPWLFGGFMPWLFRPRFGWGRGGGCGCGGLGCLILLCLGLFVISGGLGSLYQGYGYGAYPGGYNPNSPNSSGPVAQPVSGLAGEPPSVQTQTAVDLRELHAALDQRIAQWQNQLTADEYHTISGQEAGLVQDNNTKEVDYGKCGQGFYTFVVANTKPDTGPADGEGYAYTTASSPGACHPPAWNVYDSEDFGGGWWFVTLKSVPGANQGR